MKNSQQPPPSPSNQDKYTCNLLKGTSLLNEMLILIEMYNPERDDSAWVDFLVKRNALGKASRSRTKDIITRHFIPRYVRGTPQESWKVIKKLMSTNAEQTILRLIMYYQTCKSDSFLYDFVTQELYDYFFSGKCDVSAGDVRRFIGGCSHTKFKAPWSTSVKERMARNTMTTLRDFGILEGKAKKKISNFFFPLEAFTYVAYHLKSTVQSGSKTLQHKDWRLFFLDTKGVERMFLRAHQQGLLHYEAAGKLIRIEFDYNSMEELANGLAS